MDRKKATQQAAPDMTDKEWEELIQAFDTCHVEIGQVGEEMSDDGES